MPTNVGLSEGIANQLEVRGLASFSISSHEEIDRCFGEVERDLEERGMSFDPVDLTIAREVAYLSAAEFALLRTAIGSDQPLPPESALSVDLADTQLALLKSDSTLINPTHAWVEMERVPLWDITLFSSDISKVMRSMNLEIGAVGSEQVREVISELDRQYRSSGAQLARSVAERGLLRAQGLFWMLKYLVIEHPDPDGLRTALDDFVGDYFGQS